MKRKSNKNAVVLNELKGRIRAEGYTLRTLAPLLNTTASTLSLKLNGKANFTMPEIEELCRVLGICVSQVGQYFFPHMFPNQTKGL
jgi:transcriptional regulator with XRE-family HTH domain